MRATRPSYPSDLTDEAWAGRRRIISRPSVSRREMVAIFYALRNGIPWRAMTQDLPHWPTVYPRFRKWQKEGILEYPQAFIIFCMKVTKEIPS
ncbi:transposase, partial [Allomeiothermus silvanus]|uniref:transposase n=1 Tax=Allomeiothermus silvanus TaxID=52022 RepID=UPI003C6C82A5